MLYLCPCTQELYHANGSTIHGNFQREGGMLVTGIGPVVVLFIRVLLSLLYLFFYTQNVCTSCAMLIN